MSWLWYMVRRTRILHSGSEAQSQFNGSSCLFGRLGCKTIGAATATKILVSDSYYIFNNSSNNYHHSGAIWGVSMNWGVLLGFACLHNKSLTVWGVFQGPNFWKLQYSGAIVTI